MTRAAQSLAFVGVLLSCRFCDPVTAADWPQFRHDASRTAATAESLAPVLELQWIRELPPPQPAFPGEVRLRFDASYEPVVLGQKMFVPSMVTDSVTALDTETGGELWRFVTDGPVRFAPVAWQDKVYAASDDGHLYCLDAASGELQWKYRGLPDDREDRKLLGNGRLISLWPARGGPVLSDGIAYFAAGIWPEDGVFVHALDATSGRVIWSNTTSNRIPNANMDHGISQYAGLTPQGYLAMVQDQLVVPCGAQLPAFLDPKTGVLGDYMMGWGGRVGLPKGSWFAAGIGEYMSHSGDLYDIARPNEEKFSDPGGRPDFKHDLYPGGFTRLRIDPANQRALGAFREPVLTHEAMYYNDGSGIAADGLTQVELLERSKITPEQHRATDKYPDKWKANVDRLWSLPSKLQVHIKAGPRLYLGGDGVVQAVDIPQRGDEPRVSWSASIEGTPHRMLAADGRLFVITQAGRIYAFGAPVGADAVVHKLERADPPFADQWTAKADELLAAAATTEGYAIVLGIEDERLVEELVRRSELYVIAIDPDQNKVERVRHRLNRAGLYGTRASIHVGDPISYPLPPYLANLVVASDLPSDDNRHFAGALFHVLRPYGGTALVRVAQDQREALHGDLVAAQLPSSVVRQRGNYVQLTRQGALPAAADWSHAGADAANAGASQDRFLKAPLELLWWDASLRWNRKPGSAIVRIAGGRAIVQADDLHAIDVYTGRRLWTVEMAASLDPQAELVAVEDGIYLARGSTCRALDPATGRESARFDLPADTEGRWSNLRVWQEYLVGTVGKHVVCVNRRTGQLAWKHECARNRLSVAVGGGHVFCAELLNERRGETIEGSGVMTRSLNIETGDLSWQVAGGHDLQYSPALDLIVTSDGVLRGTDGRRVRDGIVAAQLAGEQVISGTTDQFVVYDLESGERAGDALKWNRRGCTGLRTSCNLVTTRFKANAAYVDLETRDITPLWNIRSGCNNNLFPANGILNVPNVTGGCECNYTPTSMAFAPSSVIKR